MSSNYTTIRVSRDTLLRLQSIAKYGDTMDYIVRTLIDHYENRTVPFALHGDYLEDK